MGECPPLFGKVVVFVAYVKESMETHYRVAQQSLECYLKGVNYTVLMPTCQIQIGCLYLTPDTGVVNPNHCIEEWIDDRVDIIFYERFFNWEIASGNYIVRNTDFAVNFLKDWGDWEFTQPSNWNGADNGVLQLLIMKTVLPWAVQETENCDNVWHNASGYESYLIYVSCVKQALGATRFWPGKIRIYHRAHGWVRDGFITTDKWSDADFMLHGWKAQKVGESGWESPFKKNLDPSLCGPHYNGWDWIIKKRMNVSDIKEELARFERYSGRTYPKEARQLAYLSLPDVGECYPHCGDST
ncbi:hypothetical protein COOONC_07766 [Cooperia oncophora]